MKKEFTRDGVKALDSRSDVDLIEELDRPISESRRELIKLLLGRRQKRVVQHQTEVIQENSRQADKLNRRLLSYTIAIFIISGLMLAGLVIQIVLALTSK